MRRRRSLAQLIVALLVAPLLVVLPTSTAQAVEEATLAWSHEVTQLRPTGLISQINGNVTVSQCADTPTNDLAVKDYHVSGSLVWIGREIASNVSPRPYVCPALSQAAVDKDGTLYAGAQEPPQYHAKLVAYEPGGARSWVSSSLPHSCTTVEALTIGTNGNVYAVIGSCQTAGAHYLFGVEPDLDQGETEPDSVLDVQIGEQWTSGGLAAYNGGLIVQYANGIQYYSYGGSTGGLVSINGFVPTWQLSATVGGRVFLAAKNNQLGCTSAIGYIVAIEPSGTAWSHTSLPACTTVHELRPRHDGGVVAHVTVNDGIVNEQRFIALNSSGQQTWTVDYEGNFHPGWAVTLNGDVAISGMYRRDGWYYGVRFALLSGVSGETLSTADLGSETDGYYPINQGTEIVITKNRAYFALGKCNGGGYSCDSDRRLYALNVPGLEMDYPRGAILRYSEPWKSLVVLGESFSSGQGVPQYEAGTDTAGPPENRCRRSEGAYARLLDGAPANRLNLQAFVACGGSEITHVLNGRFGEAPQVEALSTATDVVTITIGGNDIGFESLAAACVIDASDCAQSASYSYALDFLENYLPDNLDTLFTNIASRIGPQTRVLVVGYPLMIPEAGKPTSWPNCIYLSDTEKAAVRGVIAALNQVLRDAVNRAGNQFEYVGVNDASSPFKGHELCNDGSYFHGIVAPPNDSYSFHPNAAGQDAYHRVIARHL